MTMPDFATHLALAKMDLGPFVAKPTSIEGNQSEASVDLWTSPDGRVALGVWECTPGRFTADRAASTEFCHFLSGRVEMTHSDGTVQAFGPGDAITLPQGWKGVWRVVEQVRKIYVITQG
jgi:uncharacterized cupin superfamily protein